MGTRMIESFYSGKRVLITGGLGHIGSSLAHRLSSYDAKVTIVDALLPLYGGNRYNLNGIDGKVGVHLVDIRDVKAMEAVLPGQEYIFHLAGQVSHHESVRDPATDYAINVGGTTNLIEACRRVNGEATILFAGTRFQYGKIKKLPVDEEHPVNPLSPYASNKLEAEGALIRAVQEYGLRTAAVRIANPYGPRGQMKHNEYGIVNWFIRLAMEDQLITVFGSGKQLRDYIFIDDLVDAFLHVGVLPVLDGVIFNVGSGFPTPFQTMASLVVQLVGSGKVDNVPWPERYKNVETGGYVTDISKIARATGWEAQVSLEDGIRATYEFYRKYRSYYW